MQEFYHYDFAGKRVLVRVDFNVPFDKSDSIITDTTRIQRVVPTIEWIVSHGGRVVLLSHMGRPKGKVVPSLSLGRIVQTVSTQVGKHVTFCDECVGERALAASHALQDGEILLLENVRFHAEDEGKVSRAEGESDEAYAARKASMKEKQRAFAKELAQNGDCFVHDAFAAAHRAHASTSYIAEHFPHDKMFGPLMMDELKALDRVMEHPERPLTAIMGGAKVSDKILLIENLIDRVDRIIIGGGMTYTFIRAKGGHIGQSLCEEDRIETARLLMEKAAKRGVELLLPEDAVNADRFDAEAQRNESRTESTPDGWMGLDIGPRARAAFRQAIIDSKTVLWNGPMGVFEMPAFADGTKAIAEALAEATQRGTYTLVGGGDSVAALKQSGCEGKVSYVSTGGGAMLEYLEGRTLPGVAAIRE